MLKMKANTLIFDQKSENPPGTATVDNREGKAGKTTESLSLSDRTSYHGSTMRFLMLKLLQSLLVFRAWFDYVNEGNRVRPPAARLNGI